MSQGLNIFELSRIRDEDAFNILKRHMSLSGDKRITQYHEIESFRFFVDALMEKGVSSSDLDNFFYGYSIERIGKEFDLLRITDGSCLNIELKSMDVPKEQILRQLLQNRYYLNHLERKQRLFSVVTDSMTCYTLSADGSLKDCRIEDICEAVRETSLGSLSEIDSLFKHSKFLVSPINTPERFIEGEYFLTQAQDVIKTEILKASEREGTGFIHLTGMPGTGKTLLLYDLAKVFAKKSKTLIIHCGPLLKSQRILSERIPGLDIFSSEEIDKLSIEDYRYLLVDETHRIDVDTFDKIVSKAKDCICIFSTDPRQLLTTIDKEKDISGKIDGLENVAEFKLSERIRSNKEIRFFILQLMDQRNKPREQVAYENISLAFANTSAEAQEMLSYFKGKAYVFINYTRPKLFDDPFAEYEEDIDTAHVAGQEFDNVVMLLDDSFYYDERGRLQGIPTPDPDYLYPNLFYQGITRAREKLAIIVVRNERLFNDIAKNLG